MLPSISHLDSSQSSANPTESQPASWTLEQAREVHQAPLLELVYRAQTLHREHHPRNAVQLCSLLSVKTGGCAEDCAYCPQSSHHDTTVEPERLLDVDDVLDRARGAKSAGASRFCMGVAWREVRQGPAFERLLSMVRGVRELGMEACLTAGMLTPEQASELRAAGLTAYNHNLDTSRQFYGSIISTRTFDDRLATLRSVSAAGISVCSGGIIGMGESIDDRVSMLVTLANLDPQPESVPINALVPVEGTPLADRPPVEPMELVRMCATARIMMPKAMVRLSAGRQTLSKEAQALCFIAGANSVFYGEKLLTTGNPDTESDQKLLSELGLQELVPTSL